MLKWPGCSYGVGGRLHYQLNYDLRGERGQGNKESKERRKTFGITFVDEVVE